MDGWMDIYEYGWMDIYEYGWMDGWMLCHAMYVLCVYNIIVTTSSFSSSTFGRRRQNFIFGVL